MKKTINGLKAFFADETGAETVEWVMVAAILAGIITIVFWTTLQNGLNTTIGNIVTSMETAGQ